MAWQPYAQENSSDVYSKQILKLFPDSKSGKLRLYSGEVVGLSVTLEGMERYRIHYPEDNDRKEEEVGNVLPWLVTQSGQIFLEARSAIDPAGLTREEYIVYSMLATKPDNGHLRNWGKELCAADPHYADFESFTPKYQSSDAAGPSTAPGSGRTLNPAGLPAGTVSSKLNRPQNKKGLLHEKRRLDNIAAQAEIATEKSQRRHERGYAKKRKPRNRRVKALEVGSRCNISLRSRTNRTTAVQSKVWEKETYVVTSLAEHKIFLRLEGGETSVSCLREDVLPIFTPAF
ncbi:hypothetical protein WJX74_002396 [Apatococcus lobatus]|uniref:Uncharacterized protein n=1 Tax=Apatococcus lobatus TaxID=904363 RepID=A0AAW1SF17_9CHLO